MQRIKLISPPYSDSKEYTSRDQGLGDACPLLHRLVVLTLVVSSLIVLGLVVSSCTGVTTTPRPLLNSERIEATFGSYGVEILHATDRLRVSSLYSLEDVRDGSRRLDRRVTRTFAVVRFPESVDPRVAEAHREIVDGGSIGATLRAHGWSVSKQHLHLGEIESTDDLRGVYALMEVEPGPLAVDVYRLKASRDGAGVDYATLAEVHHPRHLDVAALRRIVDPERTATGAPTPEVVSMLALVVEAAARLGPPASHEARRSGGPGSTRLID